MKQILSTLGLALSLATSAVAQNFDGAVPQPVGRIKESVTQLRITFPESMIKDSKEAFKVDCKPALAGFSGWADNNTIWTYDFKAKNEYQSARLVGGTKCQVTQTADLKSGTGKIWKSGAIVYSVVVAGPNVLSVIPASAFKGTLRETDPVLMITFDGPVDANKFFAEQNGYLNYLSSNAPSEKMSLTPVPLEQTEKIFEYFKSINSYSEVDFTEKTWLLATIKQNLIPGSQINLTILGQRSADNADVQADSKFSKEFSVRSQFQAEVECASPSSVKGNCLPNSPVSIVTNGLVKWADIKDAYIEYIPYGSTDQKTVRSFAEIESSRQIGFWDSFINYIARFFPFVAKYSDTILDSVVFNVNIEPQTQAKVVIPQNLKDIEGRQLANVLTEFFIRIGAMDEVIRVPQRVSFFERNIDNLYLPVGVVNANQVLKIRKSGVDAAAWESTQSFPAMIKLITAYSLRGDYRETPDYVSPLEQLGVSSNLVEEKLTGVKNRPTVLQFPFVKQKSGMYAIEVSSPAFEAARSDANENRYYNPKYVLAQVTDLAIHIKKGTETNIAWVTRLSDAKPAIGAQLEIYNCLGELVTTLATDASGIATFPNQEWAKDCKIPTHKYSEFLSKEEFFLAAKLGDDVAMIHTTWNSATSYAMGAPGIDWFSSSIQENQTYFHAVIGVNLVKPGQQVPIELIAKVPKANGFQEVAVEKLPSTARIVSMDDDQIYYELPIQWSNGKANLVWNVPSDSSVKLGRYGVILGAGVNSQWLPSGDIEVAEFKIPLMSGIIAFPTQELVKPDSIPVNAVIRYANGVGAKKLPVEISYYFGPTEIQNKDLPGFNFGNGNMTINNEDRSTDDAALPNNMRPAVIAGLETAEDGSLNKDLALEKSTDGRGIGEILKSVDRPQKLVVRVRYQDQVGEYQTLSQAKNVYNAETYVGTNLISGARAVARLQAAVVNVKSLIVTDLSDLEFKVIRIETRVIGEELFGGLIKNTLERELKPVRWAANCLITKGIVSCPVGALKEGSYAFQVNSKTSKQASHALFKVDKEGRVYGPNDYYNFGDDEGAKYLPLALDKENYKDGEKAVVSFASPFKTCSALVTVERNNVIEHFVSANACEAGQVEVPVVGTFAPNVFVSVYAITGRAETAPAKMGELDLGRPTYRLGYANLKVNWGRYKSTVAVKTDKQKYEPGQDVNVEVTVQAEEGQLLGTTVTLIAIEEKILELKKNDTYAVLEALMQMREHNVRTITVLERVETVTNDEAGGAPENGDARKGGDEGGDGSSQSDFKRKLFNALVAYQSNVPVVNGVAKFTFRTNDSLTKFKVIAVATDSNNKFGTGDTVYLSEKDTQAYSNIPTVAHTGDSYPLKVTVQNNSAKSGEYKVEITMIAKDKDGKIINERKVSKTATIDKSGSKTIDVGNTEVDENASTIEYVVRVYDENGKLVDILEPEAQTILASVPVAVHDSQIAQLEKGSLTKSFVKDASALDGKGEVRVLASKSLVSSALTQVTSRLNDDKFADFFILSKFQKALLLSTEANPEELKSVLQSLLGYIDNEGFVKYYPQASRGSVYLTASILNSLQLQPWALKLMPTALSERMKGALAQVLSKSVPPVYLESNGVPTARDWMRAQVVAGRAAFAYKDAMLLASARAVNTLITEELKRDPNAYGLPVEKWSNDELVERWLLEVVASPNTAGASAIYQQLINPARLIYAGNMAKLNGSPNYSYTYSDETIETAKLLFGHSQLNGDKNLARALAVGLVNVSAKGWYSVSTITSVTESLKSFGRAYESEMVTGSTLIAVPEEQQSTSVDFDQKDSGALISSWKGTKATVQVNHGGQGQPWVSIQALSAVPLKEARGQGLFIDKQVRNISRESGYQAGDIIEVTLNINANSTLKHVALLEPIPAGSNILAEAYGAYSSGQKSYSGYKLYFETLATGLTTVKFQYQLNNPGVFKLPPTRAEGLFLPSIFAETPNAAVKVQ